MQATADAISLKPPSPGRWMAPIGLALVAHALLMAALTWGVNWQHDATPVAVEAELWSRLPQQAAPRAVEPPPPPPPPPAPKPVPRPEPRPEPAAKAPPPPAVKQPDIATAQAKKKQEDDKRAREQAEKERQAKAQAEKVRADKLKAEQAKKAADQRRQEQARKAAQEQRDAEATQRLREENLRRIMGQAGATGSPQSTGTAQQSSGPSAGYGARVAARIRPNVLFTDPVVGNPKAEIEVRALPDGTITGRRLVRSSGSAAWDKAALDAIDRTASLPRDVDGRVPSSMIISMRPLD